MTRHLDVYREAPPLAWLRYGSYRPDREGWYAVVLRGLQANTFHVGYFDGSAFFERELARASGRSFDLKVVYFSPSELVMPRRR
jgi:hypothetical protein